MDQNQNISENGTKETPKQSLGTKAGSSRTGSSLGPGMAMKIPKQPTKSAPGPKKSRSSKKDSELANGSQTRNSREGRRPVKDEKARTSPPIEQSNCKSASRHGSISPVKRKDSGDAAVDRSKTMNHDMDLGDIEATSQNLKQLLSIGGSSRITYSRLQLLNISENPSSKNRPDCLGIDFNATNGRWDPETWHRSLISPPTSEKKPSLTDDSESSGIVLGPQRRSFQDGCHVTNTSRSKLHNSSQAESTRHSRPRLVIRQRSEITEYDAPPRERQIESASALRTEEFDWDRRDNKRDIEFRERKSSHSRGDWYPGRRERRFSNNEPEPEWYTAGPTSQSETIDLAGFAEETPAAAADFSSWGGEIPMDDLDLPDKSKEEDPAEVKETDKETTGSDKMKEVPEFSSVMEEILKESEKATEKQSDGSRFSQWFQKNIASEVSTPQEDLENIAESAAERGLASPTDLEPPAQNDLLHLLSHVKSENESGSLKPDSAEQQELLRQQMKLGSVMNVADIEANAGARQSPSQSYGGVDLQNTDAFNKLVASLREKDKYRQQQQQIVAQQALLQGNGNVGEQQTGFPVDRTPSPDDMIAQNALQQSLIRKQLERQKAAYSEKVRLIEQQRREEQLREALRAADLKLRESNKNKSLAFMPTSVMRKMQESRDEGIGDDLASATASFSAKLANKKSDPVSNDLLARIYQSASQPKRQEGLRRNASYPEVLMDANKLGRSSAFHMPARQNAASSSIDLSKLGDVDTARLRLLEMQNTGAQNSKPGTFVNDVYGNNLLRMDGVKYDRQSPRNPEKAPDLEAEKNQHEVAALTQAVLKQIGITEDQLSRLTPQQQQQVVRIVQSQFYELQAQKLEKKARKDSKIDSRKLEDFALLKQTSSLPPNSLKFASQAGGIPGVTAPGPIPGMLPVSNPYQLRVAPPLSFISPMTRAPVMPAFLPPQPHLSGRILPPNIPLASPIGNPAAALMQMQILQQQQQQRLYAAAFQQQQQLQALAAVRQQAAKNSREFSNPLERWFGPDILSQSQLPAMNSGDVERQQNKE